MSRHFTLITTMKNEGAFLLEWMAHHKALGFDSIVICTNDCEDPTRDMAERLSQMGLVQHHVTKQRDRTSIPRAALQQVMRLDAVRTADRVYICNPDEFLVVQSDDGSVRALTAAATAGAEVIGVPWRIFGPDGTMAYQDRPVTGQFQRANAPHPLRPANPKSLFRGNDRVQRIGIHAPVAKPVAKPDRGRPLRRQLPGGLALTPLHHPIVALGDYRFAQVNHYALRSRESALVKRDRGRVNHSAQTLDYWPRFDLAEVPCTAIRRYDGAVADWRVQLMADRALARMHQDAVAWLRTRIATLLPHPDYQDLLRAIAAQGAT